MYGYDFRRFLPLQGLDASSSATTAQQVILLPPGLPFQLSGEHSELGIPQSRSKERRPRMLVLSRRQDDKILFPALGISVHVLRVDGGKVRVGVDAPPEVKILRHELEATPSSLPPELPADLARSQDKQLQRHLAAAAESLNRLHQLGDGDALNGSDELIFEVFNHLKSIDRQVAADAKREPVIQEKAPRTALLVDDNLNECKLLASYLRLRHFDVATASDGAAALEYLSTHKEPDVVLLDMQMPGMDGPTAIRKMRDQEQYTKLKVFAVSGGDPADYGVDVSPEGVNGWFPKPLDPEALVFRLALDSGEAGSQAAGKQVQLAKCS